MNEPGRRVRPTVRGHEARLHLRNPTSAEVPGESMGQEDGVESTQQALRPKFVQPFLGLTATGTGGTLTWKQTRTFTEYLGAAVSQVFAEESTHSESPGRPALARKGFGDGFLGLPPIFFPYDQGVHFLSYQCGQMVRKMTPLPLPKFPGPERPNINFTTQEVNIMLISDFSSGVEGRPDPGSLPTLQKTESSVLCRIASTHVVEDILAQNQWKCSPSEFETILRARMLTISNNEGGPEDPYVNTHIFNPTPTHRPLSPPKEIPFIGGLGRRRREEWGPRSLTTKILISDEAIPSFLQGCLPDRMSDPREEESLDSLREFLRDTYATRSSEHGTVIAIYADEVIDPIQGRFEAIWEGPWRVALQIYNLNETYLHPMPSGPTRDRWRAECVEEQDIIRRAILWHS